MTSLASPYSGQIAETICLRCSARFFQAYGRAVRLYCTPECKDAARRTRNAARDRKRLTPARMLECRARSRKWAELHRNVVARKPWLMGPPVHPPTLPCVTLDISVAPLPKWPFHLRNMKGVHGAITRLLHETIGLRHKQRLPTFAPRMHEAGKLRVVVWDPLAVELCDGAFHVPLWDRPTLFRVEDAVEVSAPVVSRRGRTRVRMTSLTPIVISKDGHTGAETRPTKSSVLNSISGCFLERFSLQHIAPDVRCELLEVRTEPAHVNLGGKYRRVDGWTGEVDLEVNAIGLWLLRAAEAVGYGSRTAFGFGQIVIEELPR